jgi:hypothetical protein
VNCYLSGPWHFWGRQKLPKLATKPAPLIYDCLPNSPACFPALLAKSQELPVTQLARHVDLFYLVIIDNWSLETLSLSHGLALPIKPTTYFSQATALWTWEWQPCGLVPNKSFLSTRGVVFIQQFLTLLKNCYMVLRITAFSLTKQPFVTGTVFKRDFPDRRGTPLLNFPNPLNLPRNLE